MPSLREIVRDALDARAPDERAAHADFHRVLEKVERRKRAMPKMWVLLPAAVVAGAAIVLALGRKPSPPPPLQVASGVHLYVRVADEPESRALSLDLDVSESSANANTNTKTKREEGAH